jgi:hypothetical protein
MSHIDTPGLTLHGAGGLEGGHVPLPVGRQPIRPVERRNTSPFAPVRRWYADDDTRRAAEQAAAEALRELDRRKRGSHKGPSKPAKAKAPRQPRDVTATVKADHDRIVTLYRAGHRYKAIQADTGHGPATIRRALDAAGITPEPQGGATRRADKALMVELYRSGLSMREVGEQVGLTPEGVRYHLHNAGIELRPGGPTRGDTCGYGHPFTPENTIHEKRGRRCRECKNASRRRTYQRQQERAS